MKTRRKIILSLIGILVMVGIACRAASDIPGLLDSAKGEATLAPPPTPLPAIPVFPGSANPDEPTTVTGKIPFTSPFFMNITSEPFVMLEDQAGFVQRDRKFSFPTSSQVIGAVAFLDDQTLSYQLALPAVPQGTYVDVDNNQSLDPGVQVFAVAYWDNTWGDAFIEERDGTGWSNIYTSTITDPENEDEIQGGVLIVWSPDDLQAFPTGFGADGLIFTSDDPTAPIPAGYNIVNLDEQPFRIYKEARPEITLLEGTIQVNDFSELSYVDAFESLFAKASREYPFTQEKGLDWQAIYEQSLPAIEAANNRSEFYNAMRLFSYEIPDGHVGLQIDADVFFEENGGSFGMILAELSDGRVIVEQVLPETPAAREGIQAGAEIMRWNGEPVTQALANVVPFIGPYSTEHALRAAQLVFLTRGPVGMRVELDFRNPEAASDQEASLTAEVEYDSLFIALDWLETPLLPLEAEILQPSGLGYIRISTFSDDYHLMAQLWERYINDFIDQEVPGIIIDLRNNGGGNSALANDFAGFFFEEKFTLYQSLYYNENSGTFEVEPQPVEVKPAPLHYSGPIAVLVSTDCVSACEGFAFALTHEDRSIIVGHTPSAGAYGEVGQGQYDLPEGFSMQFPTGRSETPDGQLVIEGVGIVPDILVPVTEDSVLGAQDDVLDAAIQALLDKLD